MRRSLLALLLASAAIPTLAHADVYSVYFTGFNEEEYQEFGIIDSTTVNYYLDTSNAMPGNCSPGVSCFVTPSLNSDGSLAYGYLVISQDGVISSVDDPSQRDEGIDLSIGSDPLFENPFTLFTGTPSDPSLVTGSFYGYYFFQYANYNGTVDITDLSAVPEPSTFALLGTGVLGAAGVIRRRLQVR